LVFPFPLGTFP